MQLVYRCPRASVTAMSRSLVPGFPAIPRLRRSDGRRAACSMLWLTVHASTIEQMRSTQITSKLKGCTMVRPSDIRTYRGGRTHHGASLQFVGNHAIAFYFFYDRGCALSGYFARVFPIAKSDALKSVPTCWVSASYISAPRCRVAHAGSTS